ncbi:hypothetical protein HY732_04450 [Candidatus Uhrbacteria bacterium]|nr:hypothetical protein [Candidatus Uhrbacteria bacterium]
MPIVYHLDTKKKGAGKTIPGTILLVIPAQAGIQSIAMVFPYKDLFLVWIPASTGMTAYAEKVPDTFYHLLPEKTIPDTVLNLK